jgi:hypothetical protein
MKRSITFRELKEFCEKIPKEFLDNQIMIIREESPAVFIDCQFESENWFWDGEDWETMIPESSLNEIKNESEKANFSEILWKKGEPVMYEINNIRY